MSAHCCPGPAQPAVDPAYRRALWVALVVNALMFVVEAAASWRSGSLALLADSIDFLGDAANYALSLAVVGMALAVRARAALLKAACMAGFGVFVLLQAAWRVADGEAPEPLTMGVVGFAALLANVGVAWMLFRFRGDAQMRSVWICSRNDAIGNLAVMAAAPSCTVPGPRRMATITRRAEPRPWRAGGPVVRAFFHTDSGCRRRRGGPGKIHRFEGRSRLLQPRAAGPRADVISQEKINLPLTRIRTALRRGGAHGLLAAWAVCSATAASAQGQAPQKGSLQVSLWAASCMACHGAEGRAEGTGLSLRGRPADQLLSRLLDFKYGRLQATVMHQHAKGYKDEELRLIAEYFANLQR